MIVTVTLNPAIDRTMFVHDFTLGAVNRVHAVREDMGGKGINVSKVLTGLNHSTLALGFIGSQNFALTQSLLQKEKILTDFVLVDALTRTNTKVVELSNYNTTDINESGFYVNQQHIEQLKVLVEQYAKKCEVMIFSGSMCKGISIDAYQQLIRLASQYTKVVLDADGEVLKQGLLTQPYLIKPNIHELQGISERKLETDADIIDVSKSLIRTYQLSYVLVSMGEKGSYLISETDAWFAEALKVDVKGTVGAGDSMLAGFVHTMITSHDETQALKVATACGALAVSKEGTQGFTLDEVSDWIEKVKVVKV